MSGLSEAASFLTLLGRGTTPSARAMTWFPLVGAGLGAALGAVWVAAESAWPAPVAAAIVLAADLALTGALHFDGLADSADGLLPHLTPERRLEVMAQPDVGAFGVAVVVVALLLRWVALAALAPDVRLLAALWCVGRAAMASTAALGSYARPGGLASAFVDGQRRRATAASAAVGVAVAFALALWWHIPAGGAAVATALVAAGGAVALARRRIGGFTGDVLGATGVASETAGLLVAAARW